MVQSWFWLKIMVIQTFSGLRYSTCCVISHKLRVNEQIITHLWYNYTLLWNLKVIIHMLVITTHKKFQFRRNQLKPKRAVFGGCALGQKCLALHIYEIKGAKFTVWAIFLITNSSLWTFSRSTLIVFFCRCYRFAHDLEHVNQIFWKRSLSVRPTFVLKCKYIFVFATTYLL